MIKNYAEWFKKKSIVEATGMRLFFHEREVWFCYLGSNIGFEQDGKGIDFRRPVLIVKKFNREIFWGLPVTTVHKSGRFYVDIDLHDGVYRAAILSQLRLIDAKRIYQKIGTLDNIQFEHVRRKVISLLR